MEVPANTFLEGRKKRNKEEKESNGHPILKFHNL
jgi:hypothetical protein